MNDKKQWIVMLIQIIQIKLKRLQKERFQQI